MSEIDEWYLMDSMDGDFFFMCRWAAAEDISQKNNIIGDHIIVIINTLEWI